MSQGIGNGGWSLEVIRGAEPGRRYALEGSRIVLGGGEPPSGEEPGTIGLTPPTGAAAAARPLAPRHAVLEHRHGTWVIRDLETETGTVVNRQRLVPGSARALAAGDLIDLGGVRLQFVKGSARGGSSQASSPAEASRPPGLKPAAAAVTPQAGSRGMGDCAWPRPVPILPGVPCRSWNDVLVLTTQKWGQMREALVRGDLEKALVEAGLSEWVPGRGTGLSADERLDEWLSRLPLGREIRAELEVQPTRLILGARGGGGGLLERTVQVLNVGERLLRWSAGVEPRGVAWLEVVDGDREHLTSEGDVLVLRVRMPEGLKTSERAAVLVRSNGGDQRVEVVLEPAGTHAIPVGSGGKAGPAHAAVSAQDASIGFTWPWSPGRNGLVLGVGLALFRGMIGLWDQWLGPLTGTMRPGLPGGLIAGGVLGLLFGVAAAAKAGARGRDRIWSGLGGMLGGVFLGTLLVAIGRVFEPVISVAGAFGGWGMPIFWGLAGGVLGGIWAQRRSRPSSRGGG
jgi:hypothetical protein